MHTLLSPLGSCLLLALLLKLLWRRLPHWLRRLGLALEFTLIVLMCPVGANALVWLIESRVPANGICSVPPPASIVVLSGGLDRKPTDHTDFTALAPITIERAIAGIALWRSQPNATLVFAGGGPYAISESGILQNFAERLGVPAAQIRTEQRSQTTWENAEQLRAFEPALPERIWLVSSALHLPRALIAFHAAGFTPCTYVSDRRYLPPGGVGYYLPQSSALTKSEAAIHEALGALAYRWRAR
jgi:uncharacterized SAM-binding protein YcdF (DUF218 family)